jgi:condensin-2 complex subunit H2
MSDSFSSSPPDSSSSSRFAHFLAPIRDLASNWEIDLASELEDYLHELATLDISFDQGKTQLNFAEAAMLIQGSACVYSAKVEYLYNLLYSTLNCLMDKRRKQTNKTNQTQQNAEEDFTLFYDNETVLLPLDDVVNEGKQIDLLDELSLYLPSERVRIRKPRLPAALAINQQEENKQEFKISQFSIAPTGAVLMESSSLSVSSVGFSSLVFREEREKNTNKQIQQMNNWNLEDLELDGADAFDPADYEGNAKNEELDKENQTANKKVHFAEELCEYHQLPSDQPIIHPSGDDPWILLDPSASDALKAKPFKRIKNHKIPSNKDNNEISLFSLSFSDSLSHSSQPSSLRAPFYPEFSLSYLSLVQDRREAARKKQKLKMKQTRKSTANQKEILLADKTQNELNSMYPDFGDAAVEFDDAPDFPVPNEGAPVNEWENEENQEETSQLTQQLAGTYEDLCREFIESYARSAEKFLESSALNDRVNEWSKRVEPLLQLQEQAKPFEIVEYGNEIVNQLEESQEKSMEFHSVNRNIETSVTEVCRYFLAALQLANNGVLEFQSAEANQIRLKYCEKDQHFASAVENFAVLSQSTQENKKQRKEENSMKQLDDEADKENRGVRKNKQTKNIQEIVDSAPVKKRAKFGKQQTSAVETVEQEGTTRRSTRSTRAK